MKLVLTGAVVIEFPLKAQQSVKSKSSQHATHLDKTDNSMLQLVLFDVRKLALELRHQLAVQMDFQM